MSTAPAQDVQTAHGSRLSFRPGDIERTDPERHTPERPDPERLEADRLVAGLKAIGEPTRLRIAALVVDGELTVTELCRILGQSQPRVSRHLRLLTEAGLLERHSEGTSAYFSPASDPAGRALLLQVVDLLDPGDGQRAADGQRLVDIRHQRAAQADDYFDRIATRWESMRARHVADTQVEAMVVDLVDRHRPTRRQGRGRSGESSAPSSVLLDVGTGTGRILELLADRFDRAVGIDLSTNMLNLARTRLVENDLTHCSVRQANVYALDTDGHTADVAVLHHVLHFLDDPAAALRQTACALVPGGLAVIVDFARHRLEELRAEHNHRWPGFDDDQIRRWCDEAWLDVIEHHSLKPDTATGDSLTTTIWLARRRL